MSLWPRFLAHVVAVNRVAAIEAINFVITFLNVFVIFPRYTAF